jgi:hypothetical protein
MLRPWDEAGSHVVLPSNERVSLLRAPRRSRPRPAYRRGARRLSGATSRSGFAFQDLVLAERVLGHILTMRASAIAGTTCPSLHFGIEAAPTAGESPDWDSTQSEGSSLTLEEAKSGGIDADDRWMLWRRVRRTVEALVREANTSDLYVRLTVNAASLPDNPEYWRTLATLGQTAPGTWVTPIKKNDGKDERRRSVRSAESLANEALHVLTSGDADAGSQPVSQERARQILARFSFNEQHTADSVELRVRHHLDALSRGVGVAELLAGLRGEISQRAESNDKARRFFSADDMLKSFAMLERLAAVDRDTLRRWQALRESAAANEIDPNAQSDGLAYQDWKTLQPAARRALEEAEPRAIAILGRGGIGKSFVLRRWVTERRLAGDEAVFFTTSDFATFEPGQISAALDLGAFAARHQGRRLVVGLDGLENAVDDQRRMKILAALRAAAIIDVTVCVTSRLLEWRSARGSAEQIPGWATIELVEWPEDRVRDQVNASARPRVAADLLRLLRTPLLLDLFLRTFGRDAEVPAGLQTRHGLLQAYWDRRILPEGDERSAERRAVLLRVAEDEAVGTQAYSLVGDAPRDLTSEGLFVLSRGGLRSFRHSLLRDFAMMTWTRDPDASAARIVIKLEAIQPSLLQFGALRAVLEAAAAGTAAAASILSVLKPPILFHAGTVLGEFDQLSLLNVTSLVDAVPEQERPGFLRALFAAIKLDRNLDWASVLARLPDDIEWAQVTSWFTPDLLLQLVETFDAMSEELAADSAVSIELASRLRSWSLAPRLFDGTAANGGYAFGRLTKLLAKIDPSPETVTWLTRVAGVGSWGRFWILSELPELVRTLVARGRVVDDDALRLIYRVSAGVRDDAGRLRDDANVARDAMTGYDRIEQSLIGQGKSIGLIASRPSAFVPVAVDLVAGHEADDADEREERLREITARLPAGLNWFSDRPREIIDLEVKARAAAGDELPDAGGMLNIDAPTDPYWEVDADYAHLLLHLRNLAERSLAEDGVFFDAFFWPSVARSRSALARACVLDLLTRQETCPREKILDELLQDTRLYFLRCARRYLQRGIRTRWASFSEEKRQIILENIRNCGRAPSGDVYSPGPFLAAIPEGERRAELEIFVELYRANGWELEVEETRATAVVSGGRLPEPERAWAPIGGLSTANQEPWQQLAKWERGRIPQATAIEWSALVSTVESLVARCLPAPDALLQRRDLVERLCEFSDVHAESKGADQKTSRLDSKTLRNIARWSVDALRAFPAGEVVANCEPFDGSNVGLPPTAELWMNLANLADTVLRESELIDDADLNDALFVAIDGVAEEPPARLASNLLARVRGWFRGKARGKAVLLALLGDRVRHGQALSNGLRYLESFERVEQQQLIAKWLTSEMLPPISPPRVFARNAGQHLGWAAMVRYKNGEPTGSYDAIPGLIASPPAAGVLSDPSVHALFVGQSVFGAKQVLANGGVPLDRAKEFVGRMEACWRALMPSLSESERQDAPAFALWVFHPILDANNANSSKLELTPEDRLAWWRALKPLAVAIVRDGPSREIGSLLRCMKNSPLLAHLDGGEVEDLFVALHAKTATLTRDTTGHHWDDAISCASSAIEAVTANTTDASTRDRLYKFVANWAAPPLAIESAGAVAKRLRA